MDDQRFPFKFTTPYRVAALPFRVTPSTCEVRVSADRLAARFGWWHAEVALEDITGASITGPYGFAKTAGPAHLTFSDRGLTFATNGERGVCLESAVPFRCIDPLGLLRHPNLTVTVADCDGLLTALRSGSRQLRA